MEKQEVNAVVVEITNQYVQRKVHKKLDQAMKKEGFSRNGRTYYKKDGELIFILSTEAVGAHFSAITGWPSYTFSVYEGIWVDGICPAILKRYPKKKDKNGVYIPESFNCFHITGSPGAQLNYGIKRIHESLNEKTAKEFGITNQAEWKRRDIWLMPMEETEQESFLDELSQQVQELFIRRYSEYTDIKKLEGLILDGPRKYNQEKGVTDETPFTKGTAGGNLQHYLDYAVLFYQKFGPEEEYQFYLKRLEEWAKVTRNKISSCYYCGYGNSFEL